MLSFHLSQGLGSDLAQVWPDDARLTDIRSQAPPQPAAVDDQTFWQWLQELCTQPGVIEVLLGVAIVTVVVFLWWRLAGLVQNARKREALADYLLGVEQALQGDLGGAEKRLVRVLELDPENHYARLMLGKVLADLGQAEKAHQQHLLLQRAFAVESGENELMLAQSLLAAGLPSEAADVGERALERMPEQAVGWEFVYRARLQGGDHDAAVRAGKKLLAVLPNGTRKTALRDDLARTVATAGTLRWQAGDQHAALQLVKEAEALDGGMQQLPLLHARLDAAERGVEATAKRLTDGGHEAGVGNEGGGNDRGGKDQGGKDQGGNDQGGNQRQLVATSAKRDNPGAVGASNASPAASHLPIATFAGLLEPARWTCAACANPLARELAECPRCGKSSPADLVEANLVAQIESPTEAMDRIDANDAHVQRLVRSLADAAAAAGADDADATARARAEIVHLGECAVEELLRSAWKNVGAIREAAVAVLREMGPEIAPEMFAASDRLVQQRLLPVGDGPAGIVGRIVQGFDREALPQMQELFTSVRPDHRRILIDYFLGLGDIEAFQAVLERFPPMEILHRLNHAEAPVLERFLQSIPRGHFLVESLLVEPTFYRDDALLAAVPASEDPEVLVAVMLARGPTRSLTKVLIAAVGEDLLAPTCQRVLEELGEPVLEHVLAAYASPDSSETSRKRLARVLARGGGAAAAHIAEGFGPEPTAVDDRLRELLVIIGDDAVPPMIAAYERSGWLEKVSAGLIRRHNNRRVQLATALGELGTKAAHKGLKGLHKREKDDNLRLQLQRAMHGTGGAHG